MQPERTGFLKRKSFFFLLLAVLFVLSFVLPLVFFGRIKNLFWEEQAPGARKDTVFPEATIINAPGAFVRIKHSAEMLPSPGRDFLLAGWFRLRSLPAPGERMILLSKVEENNPYRPGYGVALARRGNLIRPEVFWRDRQGRGGWRTFAEVEVLTRSWFFISVCFYEEQLLGVHTFLLLPGAKPRAKLAGGYDLGMPLNITNSGDLLIGAAGDSGFRGKVGAVAIFKPRKLRDRLKDILKEMVRSPRSLPGGLADDEVVLWVGTGKKKERRPSDSSLEVEKGAED